MLKSFIEDNLYISYTNKQNVKIFERAHYKFDKLKFFDPYVEDIYIHSAIKFFQSGKYKDAFDDIERILQILKNIAPLKQSYPLFLRGIMHRCLKNCSSALDDFNQSISIDINEENLLYRALIKNELGDKKGAIYELNWLLNKYHYDTDDAYFYRALIKSRFGDKVGALKDLNELINQNIEHTYAYALRSHVYRKLGNIKKSDSDKSKVFDLKLYERCKIN